MEEKEKVNIRDIIYILVVFFLELVKAIKSDRMKGANIFPLKNFVCFYYFLFYYCNFLFAAFFMMC